MPNASKAHLICACPCALILGATALMHRVAIAMTFALSGCERHAAASYWAISGAHADRGPALIEEYGCAACHTVAGVATARGLVGPPLAQFGHRAYIAGVLSNNPDNLVKWLRFPQSISPATRCRIPDSPIRMHAI